jgi:hypothetical protein
MTRQLPLTSSYLEPRKRRPEAITTGLISPHAFLFGLTRLKIWWTCHCSQRSPDICILQWLASVTRQAVLRNRLVPKLVASSQGPGGGEAGYM